MQEENTDLNTEFSSFGIFETLSGPSSGIGSKGSCTNDCGVCSVMLIHFISRTTEVRSQKWV